jgi:predicted transcriptional regulator
LLKSDRIKIKILEILSDKDAHSTNELATKCRINAITVQKNCLFLIQLGLLETSLDKVKKIRTYQITPEGIRALEFFKKASPEGLGALHGSCISRRR